MVVARPLLVPTLLLAFVEPQQAQLVTTHIDFAQGEIQKCSSLRGSLAGKDDSVLLYANFGEWTQSEASSESGGFCKLVAPPVIAGAEGRYEVGVSVFNYQSDGGQDEGNFGIGFNFEGPCHFDFAYWSAKTGRRLYLCAGSVRGCEMSWERRCDVRYSNFAQGGKWHKMKLEVSKDEVTLCFHEDHDVGSWSCYETWPTSETFNNKLRPHTTLLVRNGFDNTVFSTRMFILTNITSTTTTTTVTTTTTTTTVTTTTTTASSTTTSTSTSSTTSTTEPSTTTTSSSTTSSTSTSTTTTTTTPWPASTTITTSTTTSNYFHAVLQGLVAASKEEDAGGGTLSLHAVIVVTLLVVAVLVAVLVAALFCFRRGTVSVVASDVPDGTGAGAGPAAAAAASSGVPCLSWLRAAPLERTKPPPGVGTGSLGSGGGILGSLAMASARDTATFGSGVAPGV